MADGPHLLFLSLLSNAYMQLQKTPVRLGVGSLHSCYATCAPARLCQGACGAGGISDSEKEAIVEPILQWLGAELGAGAVAAAGLAPLVFDEEAEAVMTLGDCGAIVPRLSSVLSAHDTR
ncbi:hypothetical protein B0H11DRAFT_1923596 [Mycena galericulata]|nr:hypothetical protein B0H11DRAFT_1923596 [Mycena galericulata]